MQTLNQLYAALQQLAQARNEQASAGKLNEQHQEQPQQVIMKVDSMESPAQLSSPTESIATSAEDSSNVLAENLSVESSSTHQSTSTEVSSSYAGSSTAGSTAGSPTQLDDSQKAALQQILSSRLNILTGAAGTGKTFTVKTVLSELLKSYDQRSIFITAFTGKAVLNLINTFKSDPALTALATQSMTIHKFLAFKPEFFDEPDLNGKLVRRRRFVPTYNSINKRSDCKVLIIDEVSMVDTKLMLQLVTALDTGSLDKLILVGDINQLQPVIGSTSLAFFANHPACQVSVLNEVHRQANGNDIVEVAHLIKQADLLKLKQVAADNKCKNVKFIRVENYIDLYRVIELINQKYQLKLLEHQDVIITPNNVGATGQEILNQRLNKQLKIDRYLIQCGVAIKLIGVGDNIMFTKNDYERGFINGTVGRVIAVNPLYEQQHNADASANMGHSLLSSTSSTKSNLTKSNLQNAQCNAQTSIDALSANSISLDDLITSIGEEYAAKASDEVNELESEKGFYEKQATHSVLIEYEDIYGDIRQTTFESIGDISSLILANAMTCYKAQGSTYSRCIVNLVDIGGAGINNEYAYTAVTRASDYVWIIFNERGLQKIKSRQLAGTSDQEKINNLILKEQKESANPISSINLQSHCNEVDSLSPAEVIKSFCNNLTSAINIKD